MFSKITHNLLEKIAIWVLLSLAFIFAVYFFVFEVDWVELYKNKSDGDFKNISVISESCNKCHGKVNGFSKFHNPKKIGCSSCHLGNTLAKNKEQAHLGMVLIPGNASDAKQTCGQPNCHPGIPERIDSSLMSTMSGIISVNKFAFEEIDSPAGKFHIEEIGKSASESHLRNLCASCHLGNEKVNFGPITELSRGGGCNACHLNYNKKALAELIDYDSLKIARPDSALLKFHPSLSLNISNNHCFGCHSRSGRISTGYEGWHETGLEKKDVKLGEKYRLLDDGRIFEMIQPDVHHIAGLVCIDCHIAYEIMSDGKFYEHKEEQILIQCEDCHSNKKFSTMTLDEFDFESRKIAEIRGLDNENRKFIKVKKSQTPLVNTFVKNRRSAKLIGKVTGKTYNLNPPRFECTQSKAHSNLSCNSCHTAWAPQCVGCHTTYEKNTKGFNLLDEKDTDSSWVEYHGEFFAELPTLGVKEDKENGSIKKVIDTFIPGMIMTLDKSNYKNEKPEIIFKRLFAPSVAHTIRKESRSCKSCHNEPLALGYGRGKLVYEIRNNIG